MVGRGVDGQGRGGQTERRGPRARASSAGIGLVAGAFPARKCGEAPTSESTCEN